MSEKADPMAFVLDASTALAWFFQDEKNAYADAVAKSSRSKHIIVPAVWFLEIANTIVVGERRGRSTSDQATQWLVLLDGMSIEIDDQTRQHAFGDILTIARTQSLTVYDAAYLELAQRRSLPLATLDKTLAKAAKEMGVAIYKP